MEILAAFLYGTGIGVLICGAVCLLIAYIYFWFWISDGQPWGMAGFLFSFIILTTGILSVVDKF